jgi:hypothetical protein
VVPSFGFKTLVVVAIVVEDLGVVVVVMLEISIGHPVDEQQHNRCTLATELVSVGVELLA